MRYLGGKAMQASKIVDAILGNSTNRERLIEPFMGGGAITSTISSHFKEVQASDTHPDLILMWQAVKDGWIPPEHLSEELYRELRTAEPSPLRGFAGFGCSFGGKWFGGYAKEGVRNFAQGTSKVLVKCAENFKNVSLQVSDYKEISIKAGDVVYCDPPYADTTGYSNKFNSVEFWYVMDVWVDKGAKVFVSEYKAPDHWKSIWSNTSVRNLKSKTGDATEVTDRLFTR